MVTLFSISFSHVFAEETTGEAKYQTYEGSFDTASDVKSYNITIDFTNMSSAAICLVRTGKTQITMTIADEDGNIVSTMGTSSSNARRWKFIDKPSTSTGLCNYVVTLSVSNYNGNYSGYRLLVGNKADTEEMISGKENAVYLDRYTETDGNYFSTYYTPNRYESWYRFTAGTSNTVFTLLTYYPGIRFRIADIDNSDNIIYNSINDTSAHKTQYCASYGNAEKARIALTSGKDYYMVIYAPSVISSLDLIEKGMNVSVGMPQMLSNSASFYSTGTVTATKSGFSPSALIYVNDSVPATAVADTVQLISTTSGVTASKINYWRVQVPQENFWRTSSLCNMYINIGYKKDLNTNTPIRGYWFFSFQGSSTTSFTFKPGIKISYYYEIGD